MDMEITGIKDQICDVCHKMLRVMSKWWLRSRARRLLHLKESLEALIDAHHLLAQLLVALCEQSVGFLQLLTFLHNQPVAFSL